MAKTSLICVAIIICTLPACALASEADTKKELVLKLLPDIEKQAAAIKDDKERIQLQAWLAKLYTKAGCVEKAKAIATGMEQADANHAWAAISEAQNSQNKLNDAIKTASLIKDDKLRHEALYQIIRNERIETAAALKLAASLPSEMRDGPYESITIRQVLAGKFDDAEKTASLLNKDHVKKHADNMVLAGRLLAQKGDLAKAIADAGKTIDEAEKGLTFLAGYKAKQGNLSPTKRVLGVATGSTNRAQLHCYIAKKLLDDDDKEGCIKEVEKGIRELTEADDEILADLLSRCMQYSLLASLYARAGNPEEANRVFDLIDKEEAYTAELNPNAPKFNVIEKLYGGRLWVTVINYLLAQQFNKALAAATQKDGTIAKETLPALVYEFTKAGQEDKAVELINKAPAEDWCNLQIARVGALLELLAEKDKK